MKIFPAIDLMNGKCVRLTQGDFDQKKEYHGNPVEVAQAFAAAGFRYLHVVDLDGARAGNVMQWQALEDICRSSGLTVDVGGGIKTEEDIDRLLNLGVARVNLGSVAVKAPEKVYGWINHFGADKIILSADVKGELVAVSGWTEASAINIFDLIQDYADHGIQYVTCTDIAADGTLRGPSIALYKKILGRFPEIKLTASGGVGAMNHVHELQQTNVDGVIVGKAIYENKITPEELSALSTC